MKTTSYPVLLCATFLPLSLLTSSGQGFIGTNSPVNAQENTPLIINIPTFIICTNTAGPAKVNINASPAHGTLIITNLASISPTVTYIPNLNFVGTDSFIRTVSADGCADNPAVQPILVNAGVSNIPPPPPLSSNPTISTPANSPVTIPISTAMLCTNSPAGPPVINITTGPAHGSLITTNLTSDFPSFTYVPNLNFVGSDSMSWFVSASNCSPNSATQPITVFTNPPPPPLTNSAVTTEFNTPITLTIPTLLLCSNTAGPSTVTISANPTHGTLLTTNLSANPPTVTYVPNLDFIGSDSFMWTVSANNCGDNRTVQPIIVNPPRINHPPTAQNLSVLVAANRSVAITLLGSDADGDTLTPTVGFPSHGTLTIGLGSSVVTYTPATNFIGSDSFTYSISDGHTNSNLATVSITVKNGMIISGTTVREGNSGTTNAIFMVSLTAPPTVLITVNYHTTNGTATAGSDYASVTGVLGFSAGPANIPKSIIVPVFGDRLIEPNETFSVELSPPTNAILLTNSATCTILDDDLRIGEGQLTPALTAVGVGERLEYDLSWTYPGHWRLLDTIDLLIVDDQGAVLAVRWKEPENTFSLYNPHSDSFVRTAVAGSPARFETDAATLYLEQSSSQGSGPTGSLVTIHYSLSFKHQAAGRLFSVEAFVTDDFGNQQGFDQLGALTVQ